jgi:hypothetical protein
MALTISLAFTCMSNAQTCGWVVSRTVASPAHQSLNPRFDTLVSHKSRIFWSGRRRSRRQRGAYGAFINLKTRSFYEPVSQRCSSGRVCMHPFIGVSVCMYFWASASVLCFAKKCHASDHRVMVVTSNLALTCMYMLCHLSVQHASDQQPCIDMHVHDSDHRTMEVRQKLALACMCNWCPNWPRCTQIHDSTIDWKH